LDLLLAGHTGGRGGLGTRLVLDRHTRSTTTRLVERIAYRERTTVRCDAARWTQPPRCARSPGEVDFVAEPYDLIPPCPFQMPTTVLSGDGI
jgi:hypothetical protein